MIMKGHNCTTGHRPLQPMGKDTKGKGGGATHKPYSFEGSLRQVQQVGQKEKTRRKKIGKNSEKDGRGCRGGDAACNKDTAK